MFWFATAAGRGLVRPANQCVKLTFDCHIVYLRNLRYLRMKLTRWVCEVYNPALPASTIATVMVMRDNVSNREGVKIFLIRLRMWERQGGQNERLRPYGKCPNQLSPELAMVGLG